MTTLIPQPAHLTPGDGQFALSDPQIIVGGGEQAAYLAERLGRGAGIRSELREAAEPIRTAEPINTAEQGSTAEPINTAEQGSTAEPVNTGEQGSTAEPVSTAEPINTAEHSGAIVFTDAVGLEAEAYRLTITPDQVTIESGGAAGRAWAVATLLQLLPPQIMGEGPMDPATLAVPALVIDDAPTYPWRGSHVDVARHFLPFDGLMQHLELLHLHKLNVLHLHLTDDQGWRIPITAYPKLTEVGAWRPGTLAGHQPAPDENDSDDVAAHDGRPHGGFYTREQLRTLVERAGQLGITVVPEIDMPGHMESVVAAYPELGCTHVEHPRTCWGISEHVLGLTDDGVEFCKTVLNEVADLFPGSPIHVGGDECPGKEWMQQEASRATMARIGATTAAEAQAWFENHICAHVLGLGRRVIAWDEVLDGGAPEGTTVMVWRDSAAIDRAARAGFDVIAAPTEFTYFDYRQHRGEDHPLTIGGYLPLSKLAGFTELLNSVSADSRDHLLGGQFQIWTEYVHSWASVHYQIWPRGCAIAEQLWSGAPGASGARDTMREHTARLTAAGVHWCRAAE